jgi:AcrR family transcriptional regulator
MDPPMAEVKDARREKAAATRRAIIRAAHEEFVERGFHGATVAAIAKRAGVAVQTVYFVFHTKPALISAVIDAAVVGEDEVAPDEATWWTAMLAEPDAATALRRFVEGAAGAYERAAAVSEVLRAAALTDDEVRRTHEHHEGLRRTGYRQVVESVAARGDLRAGLTVDTATDVLLTLVGDSTYHLLRTERGWSHPQVVAWWSQVVPLALLSD